MRFPKRMCENQRLDAPDARLRMLESRHKFASGRWTSSAAQTNCSRSIERSDTTGELRTSIFETLYRRLRARLQPLPPDLCSVLDKFARQPAWRTARLHLVAAQVVCGSVETGY